MLKQYVHLAQESQGEFFWATASCSSTASINCAPRLFFKKYQWKSESRGRQPNFFDSRYAAGAADDLCADGYARRDDLRGWARGIVRKASL